MTTSTTTIERLARAAFEDFQRSVAALDLLPLETPFLTAWDVRIVTMSNKQEAGN